MESATYTNWVGGVPGVSGRRVEIKLSEKKSVTFDSLFFQKKTTKIEIRETKGTTLLVAHYSTSSRKNNDFILHSDTKRELKNKIPKPDNFPFDLKENEAIISYKVKGKIKYYKIENIKKAKEDTFPKIQ
jgi:hypothetical protein